jgi:hypothetical protein
MKKISLLVVFAIAIANFSIAQVTDAEASLRKNTTDTLDGWKKGGTIFLNTAQTSLTNWAAGGVNSFAVNGLVSLFANYTKGNSTWDNTLDMGYGKVKQGEGKFIKSDDKIDLVSKYGQKASKSCYYAALFNFKTQMDNGYNYPNDSVKISKFMAPAYILGAIGMDYKPNDAFTAFIAPLTTKITLVNDQTLADSGAFGVDRGHKMRAEFGGYVRVAFARDIMKNVNFGTKIDLFSNYLKDPKFIDVNWETLLTLKVNQFISASIGTQLIYDHDILIAKDEDKNATTPDIIKPRVQFKEVLSIGFNLKF